MANAETIARLSAGAIDHCRVSGSDHNSITQSDIAAAMSGMSPLSASILLLKYAQQAQHVNDVRRRVLLEVSKIAKDWPVVRVGFLTDMINMAIDDFTSSGACQKCAGRGFLYKKDKIEPCSKCSSSGRESRWSSKDLALYIGIPETTFRRNWAKRYGEIRYILSDAESRGIEVVKRRLK